MSTMRVLHASSPQTMNDQPNRDPAPRRAGFSGSAFLDALFTAAAVVIVLLALWARGAVEATIAGRAGDLAARAVMREGVTAEQTRAMAEQLEREDPGLRTVVIGPEEARSRLALQENWMRHLPEVELADLPTVLEVRHPMLLSNPDQATAFHERLENRPEVQFVQFNALGYDAFVRFSRQAAGVTRGVTDTILGATALLYLIFSVVRGHKRRRTGRLTASVFGAAAGLGAAWFIVSRMADGGALPGLTGAAMGSVAAAVLVLRVTGNMVKSLTRPRDTR